MIAVPRTRRSTRKYVFVVHELSVASLLLCVLVNRDVFIIEVAPILPASRRFLENVAHRLVAAGKAAWAVDLVPALHPIWIYHYRSYFHNVLGKIEPWQRRHFGFARVEARYPDYAMAFKAAVADYLGTREWAILAIESLIARPDADTLTFRGIDQDLAGAAAAYCGRPIIGSGKLGRAICFPLNLLLAVLFTAYAVAWVVMRIRFQDPTPEAVLLAADFIDDPDDFELYADFADHGPVVLVARSKADANLPLPETLRPCRRHELRRGVFGLGTAAETISMVIRDGARLVLCAGWTWPGLFRIFAGFPHRRAMYRLFFQSHRPKYFWGRDPYSPHHSLRRIESNRVGCRSWVVLHAYSFYSGAYPAYRYLDFDKVFMMGRFLYERYYRETWSPDTDVVTCTTFRANRKAVVASRPASARDILIMCSVYVGEPGLIQVVRGLAEAFPERTILLQIKTTFSGDQTGLKFIAACARGLKNVVVARDEVLELFPRARYAFSDPSTVFGEAAQLGLYSFFVDVSATQSIVPLREFPGLCVSSGAQAVERIKGIESGAWRYPVEDVARFVDLSGEAFVDTVLRAAGFEPKAAAAPVWQAPSQGRAREA